MRLMHVDASPKGEKSNSRTLARFFVGLLQDRMPCLDVDYLDLTVETPPHVTREFAEATYTPRDQRTAEMIVILSTSDALCSRLLAADSLLFAMPMYNWSMPSTFKAFVDAIVRGGVTYVLTPDGKHEGRLSNKKVLFLTSRGVDLRPGSPWAAMDALTPALRSAFGFLGVTDPRFVDAQPMQFAEEEARAAGIERAKAELVAVAEAWAS